MLIVCTQDTTIRKWTEDPSSNASAWGRTVLLSPGSLSRANRQLESALAELGDEPLCLSAHGNDSEIGDADPDGWGWKHSTLAATFAEYKRSYNGPVLVRACAKNVVNFSSNLAVSLKTARACEGAWIYGYIIAISSEGTYVAPDKLQNNVQLQGTQVG